MTAGAPIAPHGDQAVFDDLARTFIALASLTAASPARPGAFGVTPACAWAWVPIEVPDVNRVLRPRLHGDRASVEAAIERINLGFGGLPLTWWLDPGATPVDLADALRWVTASRATSEVPVMDLGLVGRPPSPAPAPGVTVALAATTADLVAAERLCALGFGATDEEAEPFASMFDHAHAPADGPLVVAVASLDGRPAATALAVVAGEVAGVYNVATLPWARRRGTGRAATEAVLAEAARRGARRAVLESSAEGHPLYGAMGFRDAGVALVVTVPPAR